MAIDIPNLLGLVGAAIVVLAYLLNQAGALASADWRFPVTNLAGSVLIAVSLCYTFNLPSMLIEVFWIAISLYGAARAAWLRRA